MRWRGSVLLDNGQWYLPEGNACTTHILKPTTGRFPDLDVNEHICQQTAINLGIQAASTSSMYFHHERTLVVERFDRVRFGDGDWMRVHQEDSCQALGISPRQKYQHMGGPGLHDISGLIRRYSTDKEADLRHFLDGLIFNWIIANTDAHGKNYGFLISGESVRFAPLYDLCSILSYRDSFSDFFIPKLKLAMKIGRDYTLEAAPSCPTAAPSSQWPPPKPKDAPTTESEAA